MKIRITDTARWQLRLTIQDLTRKRNPEAAQLTERVRTLFTDPEQLQEVLRPLDGMSELPVRETVLGSYHLYFREEGKTLWLSCLWPPMYPDRPRPRRSTQ